MTVDFSVDPVHFATQLSIPRLRDGGRIINIGAGVTRWALPVYAVYASAKGAVDVLTTHLAGATSPSM